MSRKALIPVVSGFIVAIACFVSKGMVGLALDQDNPPEALEKAYRILTFPARYFPGWESWDPRYSKMSFRAWGLYSNAGDILNCLFWGCAAVVLSTVFIKAFSLIAGQRGGREFAA